MARPRTNSPEEVRQMALEAARNILAEDGVQGLSARKIASRIGYTVGSLYNYFDNLDDLILQLNGETLDELARMLEDARSRHSEEIAALRALAHAYLHYAHRHPHLWKLLFLYEQHASSPLPKWYFNKISHLSQSAEIILSGLVNGEQAEQKARREARALWAGIHGIVMLASQGEQTPDRESQTRRQADTLIHCFVAGFLLSQPKTEAAEWENFS